MNDREQLSCTNFYILNDTNTSLLYRDLASNATVTVPVNKTRSVPVPIAVPLSNRGEATLTTNNGVGVTHKINIDCNEFKNIGIALFLSINDISYTYFVSMIQQNQKGHTTQNKYNLNITNYAPFPVNVKISEDKDVTMYSGEHTQIKNSCPLFIDYQNVSKSYFVYNNFDEPLNVSLIYDATYQRMFAMFPVQTDSIERLSRKQFSLSKNTRRHEKSQIIWQLFLVIMIVFIIAKIQLLF